jgi:hypothetical protein
LRYLKLAALILPTITLTVVPVNAQTTREAIHLVPNGKGWGETPPITPPRFGLPPHRTNGIYYHGGPIMPGNVNLYFIWYGNFVKGQAASDSSETQSLLTTLFSASGLGGASYARINSTYNDTSHTVTGDFALAQSAYDYYSRGKNLSDGSVAWIVANAIGTHVLPRDANGIYFVLSSSDVAETSGFCTRYCGWHSHAAIAGEDIKIAFVGNPDRCPSACEEQLISPNGDSGADAMASVTTHEIMEATNDPDLNAWYDTSGNESGDKCAWKWGPVTGILGNGAYNMTVAGHNWLIQMGWENAEGGGCTQELDGPFYQR